MKSGLAALDINGAMILLSNSEVDLLRKRYRRRITSQAQTLVELALTEVLIDEIKKLKGETNDEL